MNEIEALKLLLEVEAGDNITTVATWYVVTGLVPSLIVVLVVILLFILANKLIRLAHQHSDATFMRWRDELGTGCPGELTANERSLTIKAIDRLIEKSKAKQ